MKIFPIIVLMVFVLSLVGCAKEEVKEINNKTLQVDTQTDTVLPGSVQDSQVIPPEQIGVEQDVDIQQEIGVNLKDLGADVPENLS